ncbi:hypothetical protein LLT5_05565 [Lactococcus cremoris subsp. cremoris TIFN5]|uniref:Uncharacterized protein n=1 Tax=Lactococcus cremoris subsp. cremoris TIFN6 TaxID=1234876 RepID=T0S6C5_LACLC|nr:hypothetical protein LLT5_05565 [Lactococcus cremoris subsp. cremoris TIFN5]EQC57010.1 hypothetical protein LLT6_12590 [Lactococcus cremoris subsp. cremoris TIFN6]
MITTHATNGIPKYKVVQSQERLGNLSFKGLKIKVLNTPRIAAHKKDQKTIFSFVFLQLLF